jgi:hypothetical protein
LYQFTKRGIKLTVKIIVGYNFYQLHIKFYRISFSQGSSDTGEKMGVQQPFVNFKKAYESVRKEVLYSILIEFGVPMK